MTKVTEQIEIAASPADVFRFCHDIARRPEWDERVVRAELLTPPPARRGALIRVDVGQSGRFLFTWEGEYADFQPPSASVVKVLDAAPSSPFKAGSEKWQFAKEGASTRFSLTWEYQPRNWFAALADALWRRSSTQRAVRRSLVNLKTLIEAG
jgi:uncharacterized protein YndB with AHSA1/START domain